MITKPFVTLVHDKASSNHALSKANPQTMHYRSLEFIYIVSARSPTGSESGFSPSIWRRRANGTAGEHRRGPRGRFLQRGAKAKRICRHPPQERTLEPKCRPLSYDHSQALVRYGRSGSFQPFCSMSRTPTRLPSRCRDFAKGMQGYLNRSSPVISSALPAEFPQTLSPSNRRSSASGISAGSCTIAEARSSSPGSPKP